MKHETPIDHAIALLNAESARLFGMPLDSEQLEACFEENQVFPMLDDMESRMGFEVSEARAILAAFYAGEDF